MESVNSNADLIKNVWEIRFRDQVQKQQLEGVRAEQSALEKINREWQNRMGDKYKSQRRQEKKPPVPESAPPRPRISVSKTRSPETDNGSSGFPLGRRPLLKTLQKGDKLSLLKSSQPSGSVWSTSWKFSKAPGEGSNKPEGSEWGKSWKCLNFQPQLDGQAWIEQECTNCEQREVNLWEKTDRPIDTLPSLENQLSSEWETSWKYKKYGGKKMEGATNGPMSGPMARLMCLEASQRRNEENCSSEWSQSWQSTKPSDVCFEEDMAQNEESYQQGNGEQSECKWGSSWKYFNHQFHSVSNSSGKTSKVSGWAEAWKISKPVEKHDESSETSGDVLDSAPLDPNVYGVIIPVCRPEKYKLGSAQFCEGNNPMAEWGNSWEVAKNMSILESVKPRKKVEPKEKKDEGIKVEESEPDNGLPKRLKPKDRLEIRQNRMNLLLKCDLSYEWNEAWKLPRSQPKKDHCAKQDAAVLNGPMILQPHLKKRCLPDWKESWKCSRSRPSFGKPSATEWKDSSLLGYELRTGREQWMREIGIGKIQDKYEVFSLPKRGIKAEMLNSIGTKEKYTFSPEWKESCKSLKHQIRTEVVRTRPNRLRQFREPEKGETPASEWATAWKCTNGTLNQDSSLWDQGWSSTENVRQDRGAREHEHHNEEVPHNGPTGNRGWHDSWRFTRGQHRVEGATAAQPSALPAQRQQQRRRSPLAAGWEDSWRVSSTQCRQTLHDGPSMIEWSDSWEFSGINWYESPPQEKWLEESMEIRPRKTLHRVPKVGQFSRSFNPDVFKERVPPSEWMESWRVATLQRHHKRFTYKSYSHLFASLLEAEEVPSWGKTWKFVNLLPHQNKPLWDKGWETFEVEKQPPVPEYVPLSDVPQGKQSEWGMSWKVCGPQPLEWDDTPKVFHRKDKVLWSRRRCNDDLYSHLNSEALSQKLWGTSWKFMKSQSKLVPQISKTSSSQSDSSLIMPKINKTKKHIYSGIEKSSPPPKRWTDAAELAKTQPRARRGPTRGAKGKTEAENMALEWVDSWMFSNDSMSSMEKTFLSEWGNSWKFLLAPYPTEKKSPSCKSI